MVTRSTILPAIIIVLMISLLLASIFLLQIVVQQDLYFVKKYFLGLDYYDFYSASRLVMEGKSPYIASRYVTPPIPAYLNIPFSLLSFSKARNIVLILILGSTIISYHVVLRIFRPPDPTDSWTILVCGLLAIGFSYPFHFLFDRGNIDSFILLLMCVGLYMKNKFPVMTGVLIATAISCKIYPVLLLLPFIFHQQWKPTISTVIFTVLLFLVFSGSWIEFISERFIVRKSSFVIYENGSIACTFYYIGKLIDQFLGFVGLKINVTQSLKSFSFVVYSGMLMVSIFADYKKGITLTCKQRLAWTMMYFPFMVAIPRLSYHYELVILIPLIPLTCFLWHEETNLFGKCSLLIIACGLALTQTQAIALNRITGIIYFHGIPGLGLLMVMVGCTVFKVQSCMVGASK